MSKQPVTPETVNAFKAELKALLEKYNVSIEATWDSCSDMGGVYGEGMEAVFADGHCEPLSNNWGIDKTDLKDVESVVSMHQESEHDFHADSYRCNRCGTSGDIEFIG